MNTDDAPITPTDWVVAAYIVTGMMVGAGAFQRAAQALANERRDARVDRLLEPAPQAQGENERGNGA